MKRLILSIITLAVSVSPLAAKIGFLEPKKERFNPNFDTNRYDGQYLSEIIEVAEGEEFTPLLSIGASVTNNVYVSLFPEFTVWPMDSDPYSEFGGSNKNLYGVQTGSVNRSFHGPVKIVLQFSYKIRQQGESANFQIDRSWDIRGRKGFMQYQISESKSVLSGQKTQIGFLEPKKERFNPNFDTNRYDGQYLSEIIEVAEGEEFTPLLSIGASVTNNVYVSLFPEFTVWPMDSDPYSEFGGSNKNLYGVQTGSVNRSFHGPVKIVLQFSYEIRQQGESANFQIDRSWDIRGRKGFMQYQITSSDTPSASESLLQDSEFVSSIASNDSFRATFVSSIAQDAEALESMRQALDIAAVELAVAESSAAVSANAKDIQDNGTGIAANATAIGTNATILGIHELRITESLLGSDQSRRNEERLEAAELRITESLTTNDQSKRNEERLETAELRIAESLLGSEQSRSNEERLEVIAADIATNSTTIQDNATGITANGTAIAGNGTSIQDIATSVTTIGKSVQDNATGIATIATSVQDNATGIATNGTAIAGNGTSIQDIATGVAAIGTSVQDNATGIAANGTGITSNASSIATNATTIAGNTTSAETNSGAITQINLTLQANQNERGRNALEIGQNQLRFQALENQIGSLGSDAAFIQKLGDEFATKDDLTTAISEGKTQGINAVTSDPNNWNIFTADQIQEMAVGDLVLTREENGDFVLNYEIQQSDNAKDWTTYSAQAETITGLPVNKAFVRIRTR